MNDRYIKQFRRMERWYKLFKDINDGRSHNMKGDCYQDIVYAFFQNCFHLKDWLVNSGIMDSKFIHHTFIDVEQDMQICRDICNGSKHLLITDPSIDLNTKIKNKHIELMLSSQKEDPEINIKYEIEVNGKIYDAFELATRCLTLWKNFLSQNDITIS